MATFDELRGRYKIWADRHNILSLPLRPALRLLSLIRRKLRYTIAEGAEKRYDKAMGIDTAGEIIGKPLMITPEQRADANGYAGTPPAVARRLIDLVADRTRGFTFVDYGAGKGRVLLTAAGYEFDRVVGVELSEPLLSVAAANIASYARTHPELRPIELVQMDAADYEIPETPCVLFFYDPFQARLMERIGQRVRESFAANQRKIFIIYYFPAFAYAFDAPFMRRQDILDLPADPMNRYGKPTATIFETLP